MVRHTCPRRHRTAPGRAGGAKAVAEPRYLYRSWAEPLSVGWHGMYAQATERRGGPRRGGADVRYVLSETGIPLLHADVRPPKTCHGRGERGGRFYNPYYNMWDFPLY